MSTQRWRPPATTSRVLGAPFLSWQARPELLLCISKTMVRADCQRPRACAYAAFDSNGPAGLRFSARRCCGATREMFRGYGVKKPFAGEDVLYPHGDFVLDKLARRLCLLLGHPTDRPTVAIRDTIASKSGRPDFSVHYKSRDAMRRSFSHVAGRDFERNPFNSGRAETVVACACD